MGDAFPVLRDARSHHRAVDRVDDRPRCGALVRSRSDPRLISGMGLFRFLPSKKPGKENLMEQYVSQLTAAMIQSLSIGGSQYETVWFWVKAAILFRFAVSIVNAFI